MDTKHRIMKEALILFSEKGYSDVYVADIAKAVGIKAPSLYKHFKSKQDIFDAILENMKQEYLQQAAALEINGANEQQDANIYENISEDALIEVGKGLFLYFLYDEKVKLFRKMLTIEQFHNKELSEIYTKQYVDEPLQYQTELFALLIQMGKLKKMNPSVMALQFYSPIYMLLALCDRQPEREEWALETLTKHIRQFNDTYKVSVEE